MKNNVDHFVTRFLTLESKYTKIEFLEVLASGFGKGPNGLADAPLIAALLHTATTDKDAEIRASAYRTIRVAIGNSPDQSDTKLRDALSHGTRTDPDSHVRFTAQQALTVHDEKRPDLVDEKGLVGMVEIILDGDRALREPALHALMSTLDNNRKLTAAAALQVASAATTSADRPTAKTGRHLRDLMILRRPKLITTELLIALVHEAAKDSLRRDHCQDAIGRRPDLLKPKLIAVLKENAPKSADAKLLYAEIMWRHRRPKSRTPIKNPAL